MANAELVGGEGGPERMPFGRFLGKVAAERELEGFTLARFVPTVPKRRVEWHRHDEAHFVFVLRGIYETGARPAQDGSAPRVIYSPPGTVHRDCFVEEDLTRSAFATLSISAPFFGGVAGVEPEVEMPEGAICLPASALALVRRLLAETGNPGGGDDLSACITEGLCLELLLRTGVERDRSAAGAPGWLRRARELLRDTGLDDGPRSVSEIAGTLGVHPVHLARRFRAQFGMTPGEYLRRCRLDRAERLLRRSTAGLAEIAAAAGFADQSHFSNAFRKRFGVSPGAFRRS